MTDRTVILATFVTLLVQSLAVPYAYAGATHPVHEEDIVVRGITILDEEVSQAIDDAKQDFLKSNRDDDALEDLRRSITLAYVNNGYIASGAKWPEPKIINGKLTIDVIEGRLVGIDVKEVSVDEQGRDVDVTGRISLVKYVCDRLALPPGGLLIPHKPQPVVEVKVCGRTERLEEEPLDQKAIQRRVTELLRDPEIARLNVDIRPGGAPGEAWIDAKVVARRAWDLSASIANDELPDVGAVHGQINGAVRNLLGLNEALSLSYGRTAGANFGTARLEVPVTQYDTRIAVKWGYNGAGVVSPAFSGLGITSKYQTAGVELIQPLMQTAQQILSASLASDYTISNQWILGQPFSFDPGYVNGQASAAAVRATLDWTFHTESSPEMPSIMKWQALRLLTTISHGVNMLGATNLPSAPNADFVSVLTQAQYSAQFNDTLQLYGRFVGQLSSQPLYSFEQVAIGGPSTVRGYVQNALLSDSAVIGSLEARMLVYDFPIPGISIGNSDGAVELCPFVDGGRGWNHSGPTPPPAGIASVGVGLQWTLRAGLVARIDYGYGLIRPQGSAELLQPLSFNIAAQF